MADGEHRRPDTYVSRGGSGVRTAVSLTSLAMLFVGVVGTLASIDAFGVLGLFLYALFGFGSAVLIVQDLRGWRLVALSTPLGLAFVLIIGGLMVNLGAWAIGVPLFWVLATWSAAVHSGIVVRAMRDRTLSREALLGRFNEFWRLLKSTSPVGRSRWRRPANASLEVALVTLGVIMCLASALASRHLDPSWGGLLGAISPAWYVGLVLIAAAIFLGQRFGAILAGIPVIALQLVLTGTPAIVYDVPRYAWTANHVGITAYVINHGSVNPSIDIYQAWPGLFAGAAWLCKVAGFASPMGVARWWPPIIDLATLLVLHQLATKVIRNPRRAWLAATIFVVGYAIGDADYYSPQSAAFLMAIGTFAVIFRHRDERPMMSTASWIVLFATSVADAITHQLTPYMVTIALVVLVVFKRSNTRWAPVISIVPPVAWALAHYSYVNQHVSWRELLNPFANFLTPGISSAGPSPGTLANMVRLFQGGSALMIGGLALVVLVRYRTNLNVALTACAAGAGVLVLVNSYGNEAAFRVVLFALPWLSILAGSLMMTPLTWSELMWIGIVCVLLPVYLVADMGLDFVYAMRPGDLQAMSQFELTAPKGSYVVVIGLPPSNPINVTGRYNEVNKLSYANVLGNDFAHPIGDVASYKLFMSKFFSLIRSTPNPVIGSSPAYYVLTAKQPAAYMAAYAYATLKDYSAFEAQFAASPAWKLVDQTSTAQLFRRQTQTFG